MNVVSTERVTPGAIYFFYVHGERARCRIVLNCFADEASVLVSFAGRSGSPIEGRTLSDINNVIEWNPSR